MRVETVMRTLKKWRKKAVLLYKTEKFCINLH
nr:hypothetical protein [Chryseobacterium sediminis]